MNKCFADLVRHSEKHLARHAGRQHTQTSSCTLTLTLLAAAAGGQAGGAARLAVVVLHVGVEGGVDQAGIVGQESHGGRVGAVIGQRGDGEFWRAVRALALLRAPLSVCRESIVRGSFTSAWRKKVNLNVHN